MKIISNSTNDQQSWADELKTLPDIRLLTYKELQDLTGLSRKTIDEWRKKWNFPYIQQDEDCQIYFPVGAVRRWIQKRLQDHQMASKDPNREALIDEIEGESVLQ